MRVCLLRTLLMGLLVLLWHAQLQAAQTYYLRPGGGNNGLAGTSPATAWNTIDKVKTSVQAGDTVNILGGTYTQKQLTSEGGIPSWTPQHRLGSANAPITIQANPGDTVIFNGQGGQYWQRLYASASYNGHYLLIKNLTFQNYVAVAIAVEGSAFGTPAHHVAIVNCTFRDIGMQQSGAVSVYAGHHVLLQNNTFVEIADPAIGGGGDHLPKNQHAIYLSDNAQYTVVEGNYAEKIGGFAIHGWNCHGACNATNRNIIVRRNTFLNAHESAIIFAGNAYQNLYVYHNTFYGEQPSYSALDGNAGESAFSHHNGGDFTNVNLKNNLAWGTWTDNAYSRESSAGISRYTLDYNWWMNSRSAATMYWDSTLSSLPTFQANTGREPHGKNGNPAFVNAEARNFTLGVGSPAIDAGTPALTTVTTGGTNVTSITVADAGYFHDGYGMGPGSLIKVGTNPAVRVIAVNYATNVLTLASPITASAGTAVGEPFNGTAPDMGAKESGAAGPAASVGPFYVSSPSNTPPGNDANDCTAAKSLSTPKATLASLAPCLAVSATVYLRGGTYPERIDSALFTLPGGASFASPLTIAAYDAGAGPEPVILAPALTGTQAVIRLTNTAYVVFEGLTLDAGGTGQYALHVMRPAHHIRFQGGMARRSVQQVVLFAGCEGCELLTTDVSQSQTSAAVSLLDGTRTTLVRGNTITQYADAGIASRASGGAPVQNNTLVNNRISAPGGGSTDAGIKVGEGSGHLVANNIIANAYGCIRVVPGASTTKIFNNTCYNLSTWSLFIDATATGTQVTNTILALAPAPIDQSGAAIFSATLTTDPRFTDAPAGDFTLQPSSPAIDAGVSTAPDVTTDIVGTPRPTLSGYDIGAYEALVKETGESAPAPPVLLRVWPTTESLLPH